MTFLELCQSVARESGTVRSGNPTTVVGQTGREAKIVRWVEMAWRSIQNSRNEWGWMQGTFLGSTVAAQQEYTGTQMSATRWGNWVSMRNRDERRFSIFDPAEPTQEGSLTYLPWDAFFVSQMRNPPDDAKPTIISITPAGKLTFSPTPDAVYSVRGLYRKDVQPLELDADVPEMPVRYHDLITQAAMTYLTVADEAMQQIPQYRLQALNGWAELEIDQLPTMLMAGPLA